MDPIRPRILYDAFDQLKAAQIHPGDVDAAEPRQIGISSRAQDDGGSWLKIPWSDWLGARRPGDRSAGHGTQAASSARDCWTSALRY